MTTKGQAGSKEVAQQTTWLRSLRQAPAAFVLGMQTRQLRDYADAPRNEDGSYPAPELVEWWSRKATKLVELSADDVERSLQSLSALSYSGDECWNLAFVSFLADVERRHSTAGLLAVLKIWRDEWQDSVDRMKPEPHDDDWLLGYVLECSGCRKFRWGANWQKSNPRPSLGVATGICPECFAK